MGGLLTFDEPTERQHLASLCELLLDRSFVGDVTFDHMFMSGGEAWAACLLRLGAVEVRGSIVTLTLDEADILVRIASAPIGELPLLTDVVDVALSYMTQYGVVPKLTNPTRFAEFDIGLAKIFGEMDLLNIQDVAQRPFWLYLVNHHFLLPDAKGWDTDVFVELEQLCRRTWATAPDAFKTCFDSTSGKAVSRARGYLTQCWRYGHWLNENQQARALSPSHTALPRLMCNMLEGKVEG